jgi:ATP-dependent DNA helicase RecQ
LLSDSLNNPLNDAIKCKDLFYDEVAVFSHLNEKFKQILYLLLQHKKEYKAFFKYINYSCENIHSEKYILDFLMVIFANIKTLQK